MPRGVYDRRKAQARKRAQERVLQRPTQPLQRARDTRPEPPDGDEPTPEPTVKTVRLIDAIRGPFEAFSADFGIITQSAADLATPFMRAARAWQEDTGGNFIGFVRYLNPDVPAQRAGYRDNAVYQAADYLRRKAAQSAAPPAEEPADRPVAPIVALARLVATILPMLGDQSPVLWAAFVKEMHWSEQQVARLQSIVNREGPINIPVNQRRETNGFTAHVPAAPIARPQLVARELRAAAGDRSR